MRKTIFRKLRLRGFIENYNRFRKNLPRRLPEKVFIWDETLNEGEQTPRVFLTYVEKVKLAKILDDVGVALINIGFPGLSQEEEKTARRISNESFDQAKIVVSARIRKNDIDACLGGGIQETAIFTAFNELNLRYVFKKSKKEILEKTVNCIEYAKGHGLTVNFVLEDASRTLLQDILQISEAAVEAGADRLVFADTVGFLRPLSMRYMITRVRIGLRKVTKERVPFSVRCHNDFGLATANTLAAIENGVKYPQTSVAGFGERAGLAPFEEVVMALEVLYKMDMDIKVKKLYRLGQVTEKSFASPLPFHKPIIGENVFSHASERYIHGMLAHPLIYEPFPPKKIGRETNFYLGKQVGRDLVETRLSLAGIKANPRQIDEIFSRIRKHRERLDKGEMLMTFYQIKKLMKEMQKGLTDEDFWRIVEQVTRQRPQSMPKIRK